MPIATCVVPYMRIAPALTIVPAPPVILMSSFTLAVMVPPDWLVTLPPTSSLMPMPDDAVVLPVMLPAFTTVTMAPSRKMPSYPLTRPPLWLVTLPPSSSATPEPLVPRPARLPAF